MRIINEEIISQIPIEDIINSMEQAFMVQHQGAFDQPDRIQLPHGDDVFLLMPCFAGDYFSTKLVTVYPHNAQFGKPATMACLVLNDMRTGEAKALLNGTYLTGVRTGALGGLSSKYLAAENAASVGVVGAGMQGLFQVLAAAAVRPIRDVWIYDAFPATLESYAGRLHAKRPDLNVHAAASGEEAAAHGDIVITCSTTREPVFPDDPALFAGKHIVAIGSYQPHTRELPRSAVERAEGVWLDTMFAAEESGDLAIPLSEGWLKPDKLQPFCDVVAAGAAAAAPWRTKQTLFKSVGIGLFDLVAAQMIYELAESRDLGLSVDL